MVDIVFAIAAGVCFLLACGCFLLHYVFEHQKKATKRCIAFLQTVKHQKDKPVYGVSRGTGIIRREMTLKHWSRGTYEYAVNGKQYRIRYSGAVTARQLPRTITVQYLCRFPKIALVTEVGAVLSFGLCGFLCLILCTLFVLGFFSIA